MHQAADEDLHEERFGKAYLGRIEGLIEVIAFSER
jgi:hypothetical protein